jgi:hypothetical protein
MTLPFRNSFFRKKNVNSKFENEILYEIYKTFKHPKTSIGILKKIDVNLLAVQKYKFLYFFIHFF